MSDIDILKNMIKDAAIVPLITKREGTHEKHSVILEEPQASYSVTIEDIPPNALVIKADAFKDEIRKIFNSTKGECKLADFAIIADDGTKKCIICIEMKKTKGDADITKQLTGIRCLICYCQEIGKAFWHRQGFLEDYRYRFISIGRIPISKTITRPARRENDRKTSNNLHDRPKQPLKISGKMSIKFNYLIEG